MRAPAAAAPAALTLRRSTRAAATPSSSSRAAALPRRALRVVASAGASGLPGVASFRVAAPAASAASPAPVLAAAPAPAPVPAAAPAKAPSKPRLPALDSLRFFLIAYIAIGHFAAFATGSPFVLRLCTQVNVVVGAFFVLSGYVAGYTATELGRYEASARVRPAWAYTVARVAGYYPLYALVQLLFGAMFVYADNFYNGPVATAAHGVLSFVLAQAWFPAHAEVWNAPTWFLSALSFSMLVLPHALPAVAALRARGLRTLLGALTGLSLLAKLAYSYDLGTWGLLEGVARSHPNLLLWNVTRFHPFYCLLEVLMGVAAARIVMLDSVDAEGGAATPPPPGSALLPLAGLVAVTVARAAGWLPLNDPLTRGLLFIPLFLLLLVRLHRNTLAGKGQGVGLARVLAHPALTYLGTLSFPVFVVHGALGQLFYKKVVATKVWGAVMPRSFFPVYLLVVLAAAAALQHLFVENKKVQEVTAAATKRLSALF